MCVSSISPTSERTAKKNTLLFRCDRARARLCIALLDEKKVMQHINNVRWLFRKTKEDGKNNGNDKKFFQSIVLSYGIDFV